MKNLPLLFTLLGLATADLASPLSKPLGHEISSLAIAKDANRNLQDLCGQIEDAAEEVLEILYGFSFSCGCTSGSTIPVNCNGNGCCGDLCGTVNHNFVFSGTTGDPISEEVCITYTSGFEEINGETRCYTGTYSGGSISSCDATFSGVTCDRCSVCGDLPGTSGLVQYVTVDCSNVPNGENITAECGDFDTLEEVQSLSLQCTSSASMFGTITTAILSVASVIVGFSFWCN